MEHSFHSENDGMEHSRRMKNALFSVHSSKNHPRISPQNENLRACARKQAVLKQNTTGYSSFAFWKKCMKNLMGTMQFVRAL